MSFLESLRKIFKNNSQIISFSAKEGDNFNTLSTEGKYRNSTSKFVTFSDIEIIDEPLSIYVCVLAICLLFANYPLILLKNYGIIYNELL